MVVEYAEHGSLKAYLEKQDVPEKLKLLWAGDVAAGVAHVHSKGFLHRDLATRNVLVSSNQRCKVSLRGETVRSEEESVGVGERWRWPSPFPFIVAFAHVERVATSLRSHSGLRLWPCAGGG